MSRWILRGTPGTSDSLAGPQPTDEGVCDGQEQPGGVHRRRHGAEEGDPYDGEQENHRHRQTLQTPDPLLFVVQFVDHQAMPSLAAYQEIADSSRLATAALSA